MAESMEKRTVQYWPIAHSCRIKFRSSMDHAWGYLHAASDLPGTGQVGHGYICRSTKQHMKHVLCIAALALGQLVSAQSYNDLVEIVRSDLRTEKQAIVLANLGLSEEQSAIFTPLYDAYSSDMKAHWDKRIALIKDYAAKYETMDEESAKSLMAQSMKLETEAISIRDSHAKKMMKVLPATTTARWVQIERRLSQIMELQLADEIPLMPAKQ